MKTMSLRMANEAFSILLPRTESPTMRAACRTSFSTSSSRWMQRTTVPSWTSVSRAISANGCGVRARGLRGHGGSGPTVKSVKFSKEACLTVCFALRANLIKQSQILYSGPLLVCCCPHLYLIYLLHSIWKRKH